MYVPPKIMPSALLLSVTKTTKNLSIYINDKQSTLKELIGHLVQNYIFTVVP